MGGRSPSQGAVARDGKMHSSSRFDLHSWQGLTEVLKAGKASLTDPNAYAEFRNVVLQYAQQGGDVELRKRIDAITAGFDKSQSPAHTEVREVPPLPQALAPEPRTLPETPRKPIDIGLRRRAPQFKAAASSRPEKRPEPQREVKQPPKPVIEITEMAPAPVVTPAPRAESVPPAPSAYKSLEEYRARISVIKRFVNAHIGNPVTLIDTHNVLGKKYMSALLAALKATGGGGGPDVESAMANLETAYTELVNDLRTEPETPETAPEEISASKDEPVQDVVEVTHREERAEEKVVPVVARLKEASPKAVPVRPLPHVPPVPEAPSLRTHSAADTLASLLVSEEHEEEPARKPLQPIPETPRGPVPEPAKTEISQSKYAVRRIGSREQETIRRESGVDPAQVAVKQTELGDQGITTALHDLLHEWSIFRGSGFFGIGPGGHEHPLYRQLAGLSMGEVIAGRYEGADPKITKVIKQYVDAWRHEQGVAYTINETFEHYLRRVVQRILKRQNG